MTERNPDAQKSLESLKRQLILYVGEEITKNGLTHYITASEVWDQTLKYLSDNKEWVIPHSSFIAFLGAAVASLAEHNRSQSFMISDTSQWDQVFKNAAQGIAVKRK